jgi:hypothetical protein
MTDEERLTWLEDQLWNGWTIECQPKIAEYILTSEQYDQWIAQGLREVIDMAAGDA